MQSRKHSIAESLTNIAVGYAVNFLANLVIFPVMGWELTVGDNLTIGVFYTAVSLARSYLLRRAYNHLTG